MSLSKLTTLALFTLLSLTTSAAEPAVKPLTTNPSLPIQITTTFPASEHFGVRLTNSHPTQSHLTITNTSPHIITIASISGTLHTLPASQSTPSSLLKNLTSIKYAVSIPAGASESLAYTFSAPILTPQPLRLHLVALVRDHNGTLHSIEAFDQTVNVVEPQTSLFDPQVIFLYLVLATLLAGATYFVWTVWVQELFPQKKYPGRPKRTAAATAGLGSKRVGANAAGEQGAAIAAGAGDDPALTSSASAGMKYDEAWIPEGHIKKSETRRTKAGSTGRGRKG